MSKLPVLVLLGLLTPACASDPVAPTPQPNDPPPAPLPSELAASEAVETALDRSFLIGPWAPNLDPQYSDPRIDQFLADGVSEENAIALAFQARFVFHSDGSVEFGTSVNGELTGNTLQWQVQQRDPDTLTLQLSTSQGSLPELTVTRRGGHLVLGGDPGVNGEWVPIERGDQSMAEDLLTAQLARQHLENRRQIAEISANMDSTMEQRDKSFSAIVRSVKAVCESEVTLGNLSRTDPVRGEDVRNLKESLQMQEQLLLTLPIDNGPSSPVQKKHENSAASFDEYWLTGTWKLQTEEVDWSQLLAEGQGQVDLDMKALLESRRRDFDIRGPFRNTLGHPQVIDEMTGFYSVTPGAGSWVWVTMLTQLGSEDVGIVHDRIETFAAYRVGDTLWIEEQRDLFLPYVKE